MKEKSLGSFNFYFAFLISETPNIIQIMGFPAVISGLLKEKSISLIIFLIFSIVLVLYLLIAMLLKARDWIKERDKNAKEHEKLVDEVLKTWKLYLLVTAFILELLEYFLINYLAKHSFFIQ